MTEAQQIALDFARSDAGGWPRAKASPRSWAIRSYRALERRGLVREIPEDAKMFHDELRLHFVAVDAPLSKEKRG